MNRFISYVLILFFFLDVVFFPFSCAGNPNKDRVMIHVLEELEDEDGNVSYDYPSFFYFEKFNDFKIDDTVTEEDVWEFLEGLQDEDEKIEFTIIKYQILDHSENRDIELPHTFTEADKLGYFQGVRGAAHLVVIIKVNSEDKLD